METQMAFGMEKTAAPDFADIVKYDANAGHGEHGGPGKS
jgi:hypothetical protein